MSGAELIAAERQRQLAKCGWTAQHDDRQIDGELLECAIVVADDVYYGHNLPLAPSLSTEVGWPALRAEHVIRKYGKDHVARLAIAGALIAAEIDRLQRFIPEEQAWHE